MLTAFATIIGFVAAVAVDAKPVDALLYAISVIGFNMVMILIDRRKRA